MSATHHAEAGYRAEVDGLRALAVLPVLAFHAGITGFTGGYVGVDVFFVISGYLISRIILRDISAGQFSYLTFVERRARRILPALYTVVTACVVPAWFLMLADDFENFGQSVAATALSCNNMLLWLTSGYWGVATEFKPLLHTWSLGVEEQFYIVYPILLVLLCRWLPRSVPWLFVAGGAASLFAAQRFLSTHPTATFLLLPFRASELLAGGVLAWFEIARGYKPGSGRRELREAISIAGLAAVCFSVVAFDGASPVPGIGALLPVGGAAALLACASSDTLVGRLLCLAPMLAVGAISYSLYLWHQPILAFLRIASPEPPSPTIQGLAVLVAFPLAWASWRWVETPFRSKAKVSRRAVFAFSAAGAVLLVGAGLVIDRSAGFPSRVPGMASASDGAGRRMSREMYVDRMFQYMNREFTDPAKPNALVLGNSFARDFLNCAIEDGALAGYEVCYVPVNFRDLVCCLKDVKSMPEPVRSRLRDTDVLVLVQGDVVTFDANCFAWDAQVFRSLGAKRIVVIGTKNFGWNPNAIMAMSESERQSFRPSVKPDIWAWNERDAATFPEDSFVDVLGMLADEHRTVPLLTPSGELMSEDGRHLTKAGAKYLGARLFTHPLLRDLK